MTVTNNSITKLEGLTHRLRRIEEILGIFYMAFWRVKSDRAIDIIVSLCCERFNWGVYKNDLTIVQLFKIRRAGVLMKISLKQLRDKILIHSQNFLRE